MFQVYFSKIETGKEKRKGKKDKNPGKVRAKPSR